MSSDDKPFACPEPGCNMRFANIDHMNVHRQKHKMSLSLGSGSSTKGTGAFLFTGDQTPTPTKCLKNLIGDHDITLFNEIRQNPFEEAFRKATQEAGVSISISNQEDSLNTPTPLIHSTSHEPTKAQEPEYIPLPGPSEQSTSDSLNTPVPSLPGVGPMPAIPQTVDDMDTELNIEDEAEQPISIPVSDVNRSSGSPEPGEIRISGTSPIDLSINRGDTEAPVTVASPRKIVVQTSSVVTKQEAREASQGVALVTCSAGLSGVSTSSVSPTVTKQPPQNTGQCVAVLVKLPNGQTLPVQLPAALASTNATSVAVVSAPQVVTKPIVTQAATINTSSIAKQKLKEALIGQNFRVMSEAVERVTSGQVATPQSLLSGSTLLVSRPVSKLPDVQMQAADTSTPNRKRKIEEEDPDERRKKFLERNRAAAARCRQKKKVWISNLEQKADDLQGTNASLTQEVTMLRNEVAQLKSLLLAHKDCPITLQQLNAGQVSFQEVQTLEVTPSGMKMVANTVLVTPQNDPSADPSQQTATATSSSNPNIPHALSTTSTLQKTLKKDV